MWLAHAVALQVRRQARKSSEHGRHISMLKNVSCDVGWAVFDCSGELAFRASDQKYVRNSFRWGLLDGV